DRLALVALAVETGYIREDVERALRQAAGDAGNRVQTLGDEATAAVELRHPVVQELLRAGQRSQGALLRYRGRVGGHRVLKTSHCRDYLRFGGGIADAPSGHGVGLGDAIHGDGALLDLRSEGGDRGGLVPIVDQLLIDLIGDHIEVMLYGEA